MFLYPLAAFFFACRTLWSPSRIPFEMWDSNHERILSLALKKVTATLVMGLSWILNAMVIHS